MTGSLKAARAAVVLVVFVIAVAVLVAVGTRPSTNTSSAQTTIPTTTVPVGPTTTTPTTPTTVPASVVSTTTTTARHGRGTTTTAPHSSVSVVVANATNTNGLAQHFSTVIGAGGWKMQTPIDAATSEAKSAVYYATGQQQAAATIATAIGVKPAQVLPLTTAAPVTGVTGTDVVVVIGQDLASSSGS